MTGTTDTEELMIDDAQMGDLVLDDAAKASISILVIDDEPSILESCETVLTADGYDVTVERRAEEAMRRLKTQTYGIVLIDQNMPQVHGLDILLELRKRCPDTLGVVMTGHATTEGGVRAVQAGAWDYLAKPFTATQLLVLVGRAAFTLLRSAKIAQTSS